MDRPRQPTRPRRRGSILDEHEPIPQGTANPLSEPDRRARSARNLRGRGLPGRPHDGPAACPALAAALALLRYRSARSLRPGQSLQAQMDYGVYDIDFGYRRPAAMRLPVQLLARLFTPPIPMQLRRGDGLCPRAAREHVHAFHHLGGIARVCLYDNFKAVVLRHDADGVLYNPKFLAFATHYGFRPQACRVRRPQTKGKVERKFHYVERQLRSMAAPSKRWSTLNEVTAWVAGECRRRAQ